MAAIDDTSNVSLRFAFVVLTVARSLVSTTNGHQHRHLFPLCQPTTPMLDSKPRDQMKRKASSICLSPCKGRALTISGVRCLQLGEQTPAQSVSAQSYYCHLLTSTRSHWHTDQEAPTKA